MIVLTAVDTETGDTDTKQLRNGQFCLTVVEPLYLDGEQYHANGTVILTLKRRKPGEEAGHGA